MITAVRPATFLRWTKVNTRWFATDVDHTSNQIVMRVMGADVWLQPQLLILQQHHLLSYPMQVGRLIVAFR